MTDIPWADLESGAVLLLFTLAAAEFGLKWLRRGVNGSSSGVSPDDS